MRAHNPLTPKQQRIAQAELAEEQRQLAQQPASLTWQILRDWLMLPEVPEHYEVAA
jgi:hypothetical protein